MCYGTELHPEFQCKIAIFGKDYMKLGITVTPKVHGVMFHVAEFCLMIGWGLGPWSEQTGESVHHDFKEMWQGCKVNDSVQQPTYINQKFNNTYRVLSNKRSPHLLYLETVRSAAY